MLHNSGEGSSTCAMIDLHGLQEGISKRQGERAAGIPSYKRGGEEGPAQDGRREKQIVCHELALKGGGAGWGWAETDARRGCRDAAPLPCLRDIVGDMDWKRVIWGRKNSLSP